MNIRKNIDYSAMFAAMDTAMATGMSQMELYCQLGALVCERPEKGAAVAAAEYLKNRYQDASGFSPRNLRRMRDFYRTAEAGHGGQLDAQCSHSRSRTESGRTALVLVRCPAIWVVKGRSPEKDCGRGPSGTPPRRIRGSVLY